MVAREHACCAFLAFDLRQANDAIHLTITAREPAREAAERIFAPFELNAPSARAACGCCGGAAA